MNPERFQRNAAIQSMGILLDHRRKQQTVNGHPERATNDFMEENNNNNGSAPRSILKGNNNASPLFGCCDANNNRKVDLNNNNFQPAKEREEGGKGGENAAVAVKKGLRWKEEEEWEDEAAAANKRNWEQEDDGTAPFRCCTVCGGRIWAGDQKSSTMFGGGQHQEADLLVHWACFRCATCGLDLGGSDEDAIGKVFKRDGRFYCQVHGPTALAAATKEGQMKKAKEEGGNDGGKKANGTGGGTMVTATAVAKKLHQQQPKREWWERKEDEFNGNKKSSTTIRYYGSEGTRPLVDKLYSQENFTMEKQRNGIGFGTTTQWTDWGSDDDRGGEGKKMAGKNVAMGRSTVGKEWAKTSTTDGLNGKKKGAAAGGDKKISADFCEHCGIELSSSFVLAKGRAWCPEHFCCANSACARPLLKSGFVEDPESKRNYCPKCYELLIAPVCHKCSLPLTESCLNALNQKWHQDCFCCTHCRKPFGTLSFFVENGKPYCEEDWNQLFTTKCAECREPIKVGQKWLEALGGRSFHSGCFKCATCFVTLEGQHFFERDQRPYCRAHANQKHAGVNGGGAGRR